MSLRRYSIDLAFQEPISPTTQGLLTAMEVAIRNVRRFAVKINAGAANEEATIIAKWHQCFHDNLSDPNFRPCNETEKEI